MVDPYIGITDFMNFGQVKRMQRIFKKHLTSDSQRKLHVGVMMSRKTLYELETKWANVFPPKEKIAKIFSSRSTMNCLHYADYENDPKLGQSLARAISYGGRGINALQLDMIWPDPKKIAKGLSFCDHAIEVILQINTRSLEVVHNSPGGLVKKLKKYNGIIHRVLLDKSMGRGRWMSLTEMLKYINVLNQNLPQLGVGIAGGISPKNIFLLGAIANRYPHISIDAQGQLRPSGSTLDPIDWKIAQDYLVEALRYFK